MSYLLLLGVIFCSALSLWLGKLISGRVIKPVRVLSDDIAKHKPESGHISFNYPFAGDELGKLASKFIEYDKAFHQFVEREKLFTANVSHELRTPIAVILGASEILEVKLDSHNIDSGALQRIKYEALLLKNITEMMLLLTRKEVKQIDLNQNVDLAALTTKITEDMLTEFKYSSVELSVVADIEAFVTSSEIAVYLILRNLLHNAYSYTSSGTITVKVDKNKITITDTGQGLGAMLESNTPDNRSAGMSNDLHCGIGLKLIQDLCQICSISFTLTPRPEQQGTTAEVFFCNE